MASELLDQFGCEGYADNVDLSARTNFVATQAFSATTENIFNITDEKWFTLSSFDTINRSMTASLLPIINGTQREFELSCAYYIAGGTPTTVNNTLLRMQVGASDLYFRTGLNGTSSLNEDIDLFINYHSGGDTDETIKSSQTFGIGKLWYLTLRMRSESAVGANDGALEAWINGELVSGKTGVNWSATATNATFTTGDLFCQINCPSSWDARVRNMSIHNGWTSADGVAPPYKHIYDAYPDAGTFTDYTNEGGATDFVEAAGDNLDTTYARTEIASAQIEYIVNPPVELVGKDIFDAKVTIRAGRESADLNAIDLELANSAGTQIDTLNRTLAAVGTNREDVILIVSAPTSQSADNLKVRITNGS